MAVRPVHCSTFEVLPPLRAPPALAQPLSGQRLMRTTPDARHTFTVAARGLHPASLGPLADAEALLSTTSRPRACGDGQPLAAGANGAGHRRARPAGGSGDVMARFRCGSPKALAPSRLRFGLRLSQALDSAFRNPQSELPFAGAGDEVLLAGQGTGLLQARAALDLVGGRLPGLPSRVAQFLAMAPVLRSLAEGRPGAQLPRRAPVSRNDVAPPELLAVAANLPAGHSREGIHKQAPPVRRFVSEAQPRRKGVRGEWRLVKV